MVSFAANVSDGAVTFLSAPIALPRVAPETLGAGGSVVVGAAARGAGGGGGSLFEQASAPTSSTGMRLAVTLFMAASWAPGSVLGGDLQLLARKDLVRILEDVGVGLEDALPLVGVSVVLLGDLGQTVAGLDLVDLVCLGGGSRGRRSALNVLKIGHVIVFRGQGRHSFRLGLAVSNVRRADSNTARRARPLSVLTAPERTAVRSRAAPG